MTIYTSDETRPTAMTVTREGTKAGMYPARIQVQSRPTMRRTTRWLPITNSKSSITSNGPRSSCVKPECMIRSLAITPLWLTFTATRLQPLVATVQKLRGSTNGTRTELVALAAGHSQARRRSGPKSPAEPTTPTSSALTLIESAGNHLGCVPTSTRDVAAAVGRP